MFEIFSYEKYLKYLFFRLIIYYLICGNNFFRFILEYMVSKVLIILNIFIGSYILIDKVG